MMYYVVKMHQFSSQLRNSYWHKEVDSANNYVCVFKQSVREMK